MGSLCCGERDDNSQQNHLNGRQNYKFKENESQNKSSRIENLVTNESIDNSQNNSSVVSSEPKSTNQSQYRSASREEMAAAAERRMNEQKARGSKGVVKLKSSNADLPQNPNASGGLRWQVG